MPYKDPEQARKRSLAYYRANDEKIRAYQKAYRAANDEKLREYWRAHYEANRTTVRESHKAYYEANAEQQRARKRAFRAKYREQVREQQRARYEANPDKVKATVQHRRARLIGNGGNLSNRDWQRLANRHHGLCAYCGERPATDLDHIIPVSRGGRHTIGNVLPACDPCNCSKGAKLLADWRLRVRQPAQIQPSEHPISNDCGA